MAIHRGIQSAIFYYVSCAPCAEARYRKKRKQEAERDRVQRAALESEFPSQYRHPAPSSTNAHWTAEIALGPSRRHGKRKVTPVGETPPARPAMASIDVSAAPSAVSLPPTPGGEATGHGHWQQALYQREDEELWGSSVSLQRPARVRTRDSLASTHQAHRNPPINEWHPAIATRVDSREDVAWMLQPPPPPAVMSGKERPTKSSSIGGSSRPSFQSQPMSRQPSSISERMLAPSERTLSLISRQNSTKISSTPTGHRHEGDASTSSRDFALQPTMEPRPASKHTSGSPEHLDVSKSRHHVLAFEPLHPGQRLIRPLSSNNAPDTRPPHRFRDEASVPADTPKENHSSTPSNRSETGSQRLKDPFSRKSAVLVQDKSFKIVQDLTPGAAVLNTKVFTTAATTPAHSPVRDAWEDAGNEDVMALMRPEILDSWYTPDFEFPKWVHEHTKREVRQRWSMDL